MLKKKKSTIFVESFRWLFLCGNDDIKEYSDDYNVNTVIIRDENKKSKEALPRTCCYFEICVREYLSNLFVQSHFSNICQ